MKIHHKVFYEETVIYSWYVSYVYVYMHLNGPDASVVHAFGNEQLQEYPHVATPWFSPGKPTRRVVATMGFNDLVVGEGHMQAPSCEWNNWKTGR